uniref:Uncharacterized protein n=1 Tax=Rhizophora mucronata TaxID=61149 RepID=A0A2P2QB42_RHIMU
MDLRSIGCVRELDLLYVFFNFIGMNFTRKCCLYLFIYFLDCIWVRFVGGRK